MNSKADNMYMFFVDQFWVSSCRFILNFFYCCYVYLLTVKAVFDFNIPQEQVVFNYLQSPRFYILRASLQCCYYICASKCQALPSHAHMLKPWGGQTIVICLHLFIFHFKLNAIYHFTLIVLDTDLDEKFYKLTTIYELLFI